MLTKEEFNQIKEYPNYETYRASFEFDMSLDGIKNTVAKLTDAPDGWDSITHKKGGKRDFCIPRYLSMYAMVEFGGYTLSKSARMFNQSHCNAIYAKKEINNALHKNTDPVLRKQALKVIEHYKTTLNG